MVHPVVSPLLSGDIALQRGHAWEVKVETPLVFCWYHVAFYVIAHSPVGQWHLAACQRHIGFGKRIVSNVFPAVLLCSFGCVEEKGRAPISRCVSMASSCSHYSVLADSKISHNRSKLICTPQHAQMQHKFLHSPTQVWT